MDYEKAYKESFEAAKGLHEAGNALTKKQMEIVFPQLAESEDESIRKSIADCVSLMGEGDDVFSNHNVTKVQVLAWLKKQKELFKSGSGLYYYDGEKTVYMGCPATEENPYDFAMNQQDSSHVPETWKEKADSFTSEDERIRRTLVEYFGPGVQLDFVRGVPIQKIRDWLEKQKEPHFTKRNALFDKCVENCDPEIMKRVSDEVDEMLEKEQKPVQSDVEREYVRTLKSLISDFLRGKEEVDREYYQQIFDWLDGRHIEQKPAQHLPKEKVFDIMRNLTALSYSERIPINSDEYGWIHKITEDVRSLLDYPIEQKPAEKQDYSCLTDLERAIHRGFLSAGVENVPVTIIKETANECKRTQTIANENVNAEWAELQSEFKNINEAFEDGKKEVVAHPEKYGLCKPAEWSEDDEQWLESIIGEYERRLSVDKDHAAVIQIKIDFLKSIRPQPHWKPTEEQMKALLGAEGISRASGYSDNAKVLASLYEELKKL